MRNLATEIFKTINNLHPPFLKEIFKTKVNPMEFSPRKCKI